MLIVGGSDINTADDYTAECLSVINEVTVNANNLATATSPRILADFTFESIIVVVQQSITKIVGRLYFVHLSLTLSLC